MQYPNQLNFSVRGPCALFTDPLTRTGGEKSTLPVPTAQALIGVCESIFWKPTLTWRVDRVRIMNEISTEVKGVRPIAYGGGNDLAFYSYIRNPCYHVTAHFEWNEARPDLAADRNEDKHYAMAVRSLQRGGRRDVYLGTRECQAYVEPCDFDTGKSYYDDYGDWALGFQFHSFSYPDQNGRGVLEALFWRPVMRNGVIEFCRPEDCPERRVLRNMDKKTFTLGINVAPIDAWKEA